MSLFITQVINAIIVCGCAQILWAGSAGVGEWNSACQSLPKCANKNVPIIPFYNSTNFYLFKKLKKAYYSIILINSQHNVFSNSVP